MEGIVSYESVDVCVCMLYLSLSANMVRKHV